MDEIDAALDFRNVSIVANYIKDRTKNAQFIIISLRNDMFELSHRLIGIYKTSNQTRSKNLVMNFKLGTDSDELQASPLTTGLCTRHHRVMLHNKCVPSLPCFRCFARYTDLYFYVICNRITVTVIMIMISFAIPIYGHISRLQRGAVTWEPERSWHAAVTIINISEPEAGGQNCSVVEEPR
jgi:RecF/RecN/SMC N terminal domain